MKNWLKFYCFNGLFQFLRFPLSEKFFFHEEQYFARIKCIFFCGYQCFQQPTLIYETICIKRLLFKSSLGGLLIQVLIVFKLSSYIAGEQRWSECTIWCGWGKSHHSQLSLSCSSRTNGGKDWGWCTLNHSAFIRIIFVLPVKVDER